MARATPSADAAVAQLRATVARSLAACVPAGARLAVAVSGGRDSMVLLDALAAVAATPSRDLVAVHVHHGLSPHADDWERACAQRCAALGVPLAVRRIDVPRQPQTSLEAEARRLRYAALVDAARAAGAAVIALAHHRDDQAETLLLQLLRGAGPHGLAAMSAVRDDPRGVAWWRPLLDCPRSAVDAYRAARQLAFVEDESNREDRHRRNALRHRVLPVLRDAGFVAAGATLARAARHQADAMRLADDLAALDARTACAQGTLDRAALCGLAPHRARNLLRWFLHQRGLLPPSAARLDAMLAQLTGARADAQVRLRHEGVEIGLHRGRIHLHAPDPPPFAIPWKGEPVLALPHGTLRFATGAGGAAAIAAARLPPAGVTVRLRAGGERVQLSGNRPRRALKVILQDLGMPPWERRALPLVVAGDEVVAVPGVGVALGWQASGDGPGLAVTWHPAQV